MGTFLNKADPKVKQLQEKLDQVKKQLVEVLNYFGESPTMECEAFFSLICSFVDLYNV